MKDKVKFRFLNCEGFCLQQGVDIKMISNNVLETWAESSIIYLLTEKGKVRCTLLSNKQEYESPYNMDRRTSNVEHDFNVLWDDDGEHCTVLYSPNVKKDKRWIGASVICFVIGLLIGWIIGGLAACDSNSSSSELESEKETVVTDSLASAVNDQPSAGAKESDLASLDNGNSAAVEAPEFKDEEKQINAEMEQNESKNSRKDDIYKEKWNIDVKAQIHRLHSMNCTMATVSQVEKWYHNLDPERRMIADKEDIRDYIEAYTHFFEAHDISDIKRLNRWRHLFSNEQRRVIFEVYGRNPKRFEIIRNKCGMSFNRPRGMGLIK